MGSNAASMGEGRDEENLRIAYLINQYPSPSHTFIRTEVRELERQGHMVARLAIRGWKETPQSSLDADEQVATTYILQSGLASLLISAGRMLMTRPARFLHAFAATLRLGHRSQAGLGKHLAYFLEACWTVRWIERRKVSHLHAHFGTNAAAVATIHHALTGLPFSFTVHGPEEFDSPRQLKLRHKAEASSFVVAITSFCRSQLYRWIDPGHWHKIRIVRCTPDVALFQSDDSTNRAFGRLICVGRLCEQKGQLILLQALRLLRNEGIKPRLILAGDGPMRRELEKVIEDCDLGTQVSITGWIASERVRQEIIEADALVLPSFAEGLPIVIMEAMALGRPVISTIIAGIPELVQDEEHGFLVPAGDVHALADAIKTLLFLKDSEVGRLSANCRARVGALHDTTREVAYLADLVRSGGKASRPGIQRSSGKVCDELPLDRLE